MTNTQRVTRLVNGRGKTLRMRAGLSNAIDLVLGF